MVFDELIMVAETNLLPYRGGLPDQPSWFVELLFWFLPRYDFMKFLRKADTILGGSSDKTKSVPFPTKSQRK